MKMDQKVNQSTIKATRNILAKNENRTLPEMISADSHGVKALRHLPIVNGNGVDSKDFKHW